jgi:PAS domain-containing protein
MTEAATEVIPRSAWEKRCIRKDGSLTWVKLTITIQRDDDGCPLHYITVVQDINARKTAEQLLATAQETLRASKERYRTTFQMSIDAVNINRVSDGVYVDANNAFLNFMGYERRIPVDVGRRFQWMWALKTL